MLFSSTVFLFLFLPIVLLAYYICPKKLRNTLLLIVSLFFYAWGEPAFVPIMLFSILMNYTFGLIVDKVRERRTAIRLTMTLMVLSNVSLLCYYKYAIFFVENINGLFNSSFAVPEILLPLGISFYTFHSMSYVIDVYRKHGDVQKNPINMALYIAFFPQLVAGPLVRYQTVAAQLKHRVETFDKFTEGVKRFIIGLAKKMLLANNVGLIADEIFKTPTNELSVGMAWIGIIAYSLQIYFDFSGYSDMAIGLAKMFGIDFLENFNYPYVSRTISEFWRRWHISLGTWFRDYVYIPLGGSKKGKLITYRNLFAVWFITGFWHGASWTFVAWGLYFGIIIAIEKAFLEKLIFKLWRPLQHMYALVLIISGWVLFRAETFSYAFGYLKVMFGFGNVPLFDERAAFYLTNYSVLLCLAIISATPLFKWLMEKLFTTGSNKVFVIGNEIGAPVYYAAVLLLSIAYMVNATFNPFIYFRF
ncbi:MBOAT family O-acyltransferase [Fictibacillus barbaricus]|uniref:MBOAT family protein n=1 Tax=Fictibacillus barbaricus TaxID=182136 RepID=A0ABS2ZEV3_9BACL|nr:MBOAT family protein [Fictibacillus barbaricus]MBN3546719.1 MBOAT family protein [Fictibacillus barbaricus]GGB43321.1 alginate O-acetylation protein [Fictibacillus barbaricus]